MTNYFVNVDIKRCLRLLRGLEGVGELSVNLEQVR